MQNPSAKANRQVGRRWLPLELSFALALLAPGSLAVATSESFQIVVNESNSTSALSRAEISRLFLKKVTRWQDGLSVQPVDLDPQSPARNSFSTEVHQRSVPAVKSYWRALIFSGRGSPPPELRSGEEVLDFVRKNSGAIGYLPVGVRVSDGVRTIDVID